MFEGIAKQVVELDDGARGNNTRCECTCGTSTEQRPKRSTPQPIAVWPYGPIEDTHSPKRYIASKAGRTAQPRSLFAQYRGHW